jgi:hypothetical protein
MRLPWYAFRGLSDMLGAAKRDRSGSQYQKLELEEFYEVIHGNHIRTIQVYCISGQGASALYQRENMNLCLWWQKFCRPKPEVEAKADPEL